MWGGVSWWGGAGIAIGLVVATYLQKAILLPLSDQSSGGWGGVVAELKRKNRNNQDCLETAGSIRAAVAASIRSRDRITTGIATPLDT